VGKNRARKSFYIDISEHIGVSFDSSPGVVGLWPDLTAAPI
jgi:hypothetical protein